MPLQKINLREKLASFDETWVPKIVGELNGQYVKVVKKCSPPNRWVYWDGLKSYPTRWVGYIATGH